MRIKIEVLSTQVKGVKFIQELSEIYNQATEAILVAMVRQMQEKVRKTEKDLQGTGKVFRF